MITVVLHLYSYIEVHFYTPALEDLLLYFGGVLYVSDDTVLACQVWFETSKYGPWSHTVGYSNTF